MPVLMMQPGAGGTMSRSTGPFPLPTGPWDRYVFCLFFCAALFHDDHTDSVDHDRYRSQLVAVDYRHLRLPAHLIRRHGIQLARRQCISPWFSLRRAQRVRHVGELLLCGCASGVSHRVVCHSEYVTVAWSRIAPNL